jgi:RsiW-degrading membrane proteinase PrsW (M82 family)
MQDAESETNDPVPVFDRTLAPSRPSSFQTASDRITNRLGLEKIEGFSLLSFFSDVFSKQDPDEVERRLSVGTLDTTPIPHASMGVMPNPWIFFRVLIGTLSAYLIFLLAWKYSGNLNLLPGLIIIGSFAVPFAVLILFFELNTPRNVSIIKVFQLVFIGGALSILISLVIYEVVPFLGMFGAPAAGLIEETGKLAALLFAMRAVKAERYKYRLNALLLGAAVGAGFGAFESAGYALRIGLMNSDAMVTNIQLRGALSPFAHVAWTAIAASAFWIVRAQHVTLKETLQSPKFLTLFAVPVGLHFIWNLPFAGPFMLKYVILGLVAWVVIISMVQSGLKEIADIARLTDSPGQETEQIVR